MTNRFEGEEIKPDKLYTRSQVCMRLNIRYSSVESLIKSGAIREVPLPGYKTTRITGVSVLKWLEGPPQPEKRIPTIEEVRASWAHRLGAKP